MDRLSLLIDWVENGVEPPKSALVTGGGRSLPLCSYPQYPRYLGDGLPVDVASSYVCTD
jgi:feruloyl esterase